MCSGRTAHTTPESVEFVMLFTPANLHLHPATSHAFLASGAACESPSAPRDGVRTCIGHQWAASRPASAACRLASCSCPSLFIRRGCAALHSTPTPGMEQAKPAIERSRLACMRARLMAPTFPAARTSRLPLQRALGGDGSLSSDSLELVMTKATNQDASKARF